MWAYIACNTKDLRNCAKKYFKKKLSIGYNHGASDAAHFADKGIPAMTSGIIGNHHHSPGEYVEIDSIVDYYHVANAFIKSFKMINAK